MASLNKIQLIGNLGRDPEVRYLSDEVVIAQVSLATSESWRDKASGEMKEATEWHRVVFFRRLAEVARDYLVKGSSVYVEGRVKTRRWTDTDGVERFMTEVRAQELLMLGGKRKESGWEDSTGKSFRDEPQSDDEEVPF